MDMWFAGVFFQQGYQQVSGLFFQFTNCMYNLCIQKQNTFYRLKDEKKKHETIELGTVSSIILGLLIEPKHGTLLYHWWVIIPR